MKKLLYYISNETNPWHNLAVEEMLLKSVPADTVILYLWQNHHTVVIGKNQNAFTECNTRLLEEDGGYLARRLSGGGCVYHDLNNLNFTFLTNEKEYHLEKQMDIILEAVNSFGLKAEKTGRNDMTIAGRKFSGNAFYKENGKCYHHGTILIDTDLVSMSRYLNVSKEKLKSKGIASVKSRVVNLKELSREVTVDTMKKALICAAEKIYRISSMPIEREIYDESVVRKLEKKYSSWEWRYGRKIFFSWEKKQHFRWGEVHIQLNINEGIVQQAIIYSDALDNDFIERVSKNLEWKPFDQLIHKNVVLQNVTAKQKIMLKDICSMIMEVENETV